MNFKENKYDEDSNNFLQLIFFQSLQSKSELLFSFRLDLPDFDSGIITADNTVFIVIGWVGGGGRSPQFTSRKLMSSHYIIISRLNAVRILHVHNYN